MDIRCVKQIYLLCKVCYAFFKDVRGVKEQPITIRLSLRTSKAPSIDLPSEQEDIKRCIS